jgi:hypothetical protein
MKWRAIPAVIVKLEIDDPYHESTADYPAKLESGQRKTFEMCSDLVKSQRLNASDCSLQHKFELIKRLDLTSIRSISQPFPLP